MFELNESAIGLGTTEKGGYTTQFFKVINTILHKRGHDLRKSPTSYQLAKGWKRKIIDLELWITKEEIDAIRDSAHNYSKSTIKKANKLSAADRDALVKQQQGVLKLLTEL